jgi:hypothetical protein
MLPFDTDPLRKTIQKFVDTMHCQCVGDLPFFSYILTFSWTQLFKLEEPTLWACSQTDGQKYIDLTDMFMASTAIPVVFPRQQIHCEAGHEMDFPDGYFSDGGTKGAFDNFDEYLGEYVRQNEPFENMYIISPMREKQESEHEEIFKLLQNNSAKAEDVLGVINHLKNMSMNGFLDFLIKLNAWRFNGMPMAKNIFISIPEMENNYPIINFNLQKQQYNAVSAWVNNNPDKLAIPIDQFLQKHHKE